MADPVITSDQVLRRLVGVRPYLEQIDDLSEIVAENIDAAVAEFERELEMCVYRTVIRQDPAPGEVEGVDYDLREPPLDWQRRTLRELPRFRMRRRPIISVEAIRMKLSDDFDVFEFPPEWWQGHIQHNLGIVAVVPVPVGNMALTPTGQAVYTWMTGRMPWPTIPQFVRINYTAGFEDPANDPRLAEFRRHLALAAALGVFRDVRDLIPSSVSLDGASQSFDAVQQRLEERQKEKEDFFEAWRRRYVPAKILVI